MSGICFKIFQHLCPHSPDKRGKEIWERKVRMMTIVEAGTAVWEFLILFSGFKYSVHEKLKINKKGTSLVAQWIRIHLPMQGTWVRSLVQKDPTCHGATKPVSHSC